MAGHVHTNQQGKESRPQPIKSPPATSCAAWWGCTGRLRRHKQGAAYGYTRKLGYHPLLATRANTGEVLHARQRTGQATTAGGAPRFVDETIGRVHRAGATGELHFRADSGFWSAPVLARLRAHDARFWITVRQTKLRAHTCGLVPASDVNWLADLAVPRLPSSPFASCL
jgi:hypothetical protein